jgi:hypothetical protein
MAGLALAAEIACRLVGVQPVPLGGLTATVRDDWTGWRLRPNVTDGPEWVLTNTQGMHDPREEYSLGKPPSVLRVAVVGSSVVYAPGNMFATTISSGLEQELQARGRNTEVMNFGTHGFNLVNTSAMVQSYVHQFDPDAIVLVLDLQMAFPKWPTVTPGSDQGDVVQLAWYEAALKRGAAYSSLLALIDNPGQARALLARTPFPLAPPNRLPPKPRRPDAVRDIDYEIGRAEDIGAPLAAIASFCAERNIRLFIMTPYGPYFRATDPELAKFSLNMLTDSEKHFGSLRAALAGEVELITRIARTVSAKHGAYVVDMLTASRSATLQEPPYFSDDAIHFTAKGNVAVGRLLATRIDEVLRSESALPETGS